MRRDPLSRRRRSELMARIRGRGNRSTELALAALLRRHRVTGWRRHAALFGRPDFVFARERLAVFVDGEFWHGHPKRGRLPGTNRAYWRAKIARNRARDRLVNRALRRQGWRVLRIWEHRLAPALASKTIEKLRSALKKPGLTRPRARGSARPSGRGGRRFKR